MKEKNKMEEQIWDKTKDISPIKIPEGFSP